MNAWILLGVFMGVATAESPQLKPNGAVMLDGRHAPVFWDDGDTFKVVETGQSARLEGFNTLESYGPVHRFGPGPTALASMADAATEHAKGTVWNCTVQEGSGGYGRIRVSCPDLAESLIGRGLAHAFSMKGPAPKALQTAQQAAIQSRVGMWAQGAPNAIVTSVHSLDERPGQSETYNRMVDTVSGESAKVVHNETIATCRWVCHQGSCLLYVPFSQRYGDKAAWCLR